MKKLFLTLTVLFSLVITANAQDVGQMWVGGSVGLSSTKVKVGDNSESYLNFKIIPEVGYVVNDKIGVGIKVGYQQTEIDFTEKMNGTMKGFTVNPFLRYSVMKGNIGGLFVDGGVGYSHLKNEIDGVDESSKTNMFEVGFRPGVSLNVSEKIALTAKFGFLGYEHIKMGDVKYDTFGFDFDLDQVLLGVSFVF